MKQYSPEMPTSDAGSQNRTSMPNAVPFDAKSNANRLPVNRLTPLGLQGVTTCGKESLKRKSSIPAYYSWKPVVSVLAIAVLVGCSTARVRPPISIFDVSPADAPTATKVDPYSAFNVAITEAQDKSNLSNQAFQSVMLREGMAMIEYRCGEYFDLLGKAVQELSFQRKETSLIGGLVQGSLGLANQSPKTIANTGALFGFATSTQDAFQDSFMYTPDIGSLRGLVTANLSRHSTMIYESFAGKALSYGQVMSYLKQYESNCQPATIRDMVNQSINKATTSDGQTDIASAALSIAVQTPLTADQVFYLYWLQNEKFAADTDQATLTKGLKGISIVFKDEKPDPSVAKTKIGPYFALFSSDIRSQWDARIPIVRAKAASDAPVSAATTAPAVVPSLQMNFGSVARTPMVTK